MAGLTEVKLGPCGLHSSPEEGLGVWERQSTNDLDNGSQGGRAWSEWQEPWFEEVECVGYCLQNDLKQSWCDFEALVDGVLHSLSVIIIGALPQPFLNGNRGWRTF